MVGLLTGFAGGYLTGQREGSAPSSSTGDGLTQRYTENPITEIAVSPAGSTPELPLRTENPVVEDPEVVAKAEVPTLPALRPSRSRRTVRAATGALFVVSRPSGAQVLLDERLVGTTPLSLSGVSAGTHLVRIALSGYRRWATTVTVASGTSERVAASLER